MILKPKYEVVIPNWPSKVPISSRRPTYFTKAMRLPKKYSDVAILKKFGANKFYWVYKKTLKKIVKTEASSKYWNLNGQALYSGSMHWSTRALVVSFYHALFKKYILKVFKEPMPIYLGYGLSISVDIYEIFSNFTPDITNMWLLEKMFEDTLQETGMLEDDSPQFVIESGRKKYYWVTKEEKRKLVFKIKYIKI